MFKYNPGDKLGENHLELLERTRKQGNDWLGKFRCFCGQIFESRISDVAKSHTRSCGCLALQSKANNGKKNGKDRIGETFGQLTIIEKTALREDRHIVWKCQCQCGNICYIPSNRWGKTFSCGCVMSKGEQKLQNIFEQNHISFEKQKTYPNLTYNNNLLRFDFYLPEYNILIEYDGILHYQTTNTGWDTEEKLKLTQLRDEIKNKWCKENHIPLLRIPYTDFSKLSYEYLITKIQEVIK